MKTPLQWKPCLVVLFVCFGISGCSTLKMKPEGRSASDQLLVAVSIQDALMQLNLREQVRNKKVFPVVSGHSDEVKYVENVVPSYLLRQGADVVSVVEEADLIVTFVIDAAGSDQSTGGWGIPIILPTLTTGFAITTIDFAQTQEHLSLCRLWVYGVDAHGHYAFTTSPSYAEHWIKNFTLLGLSLGRRSDIDELKQKLPIVDITIP